MCAFSAFIFKTLSLFKFKTIPISVHKNSSIVYAFYFFSLSDSLFKFETMFCFTVCVFQTLTLRCVCKEEYLTGAEMQCRCRILIV